VASEEVWWPARNNPLLIEDYALLLAGSDGTGFEDDVVMLRLAALRHFVYGDVLSDGPQLTCLPWLINKQP
jgi:hypothetical protein